MTLARPDSLLLVLNDPVDKTSLPAPRRTRNSDECPRTLTNPTQNLFLRSNPILPCSPPDPITRGRRVGGRRPKGEPGGEDEFRPDPFDK
jgi:hypothetical protein